MITFLSPFMATKKKTNYSLFSCQGYFMKLAKTFRRDVIVYKSKIKWLNHNYDINTLFKP